MDLQSLNRLQLKALFLEINGRYLKLIEAPIDTYINSPQFVELRSELHEVMAELDKRRTVDPPIMHDSSPTGLEPNLFPDVGSFFIE